MVCGCFVYDFAMDLGSECYWERCDRTCSFKSQGLPTMLKSLLGFKEEEDVEADDGQR